MGARHAPGAGLILSILVFLFLAGGCASGQIVKVPEMSTVEVPELAERLVGLRAVFVGELHDYRAHHNLQLGVVKALHERGVRVAVGLEMFRAGNQEELDRWVTGQMSESEFKDLYYSQWHIPWRHYRGIFRYARDNRIPLIALNVPRSLAKKVFKEGVDSLTGPEAEGLTGIECDVDEVYEELIRDAMGDHVDIEENYERFCQTQMVWDMAMAIRTVKYLKENPESVMVVIAGSAHAWRRGIPRQMQKLPSGVEFKTVVILPELPGKQDRTNINGDDTDYLLLDPWM
jgi:uncharacterized iron-regulated protein